MRKLLIMLALPFAVGKEDTTPFILRELAMQDDACIADWTRCYKITSDELVNAYAGCCEGSYCEGEKHWWAQCKPIPNGYIKPPNPLGDDFTYIALEGAGSEYDSCPEAMNLGPMLSASTDYQEDFPTIADSVNLMNPVGRDDSISFFVKGTYTSVVAAEIEGKIVVLGDFIVGPNGVNSLVHAGVGSGIVPNDDQVVMTVGGNILFSRNDDTFVMDQTPLGGDVVYGGSLTETGSGKLRVKESDPARQIYQDSIDTQYYLGMFDEVAIKSAYWARLQPNGIITPALAHSDQNRLVFSAGGDNCIQVFHADRFDLYGVTGIEVEFDSTLEGKTILINVASTLNTDTGKREVHIDNWGQILDTSGGVDKSFKSSTKASILWNFYDAEVVTLGPGAGAQFPGTILIPDGDLYLLWPGHDGRTIVGGDVWHDSDGSEFHNYEFDPPCALPLPPDMEIPNKCITPDDDDCAECPEGQILIKTAVRQEMVELCDPLALDQEEEVVYRFKVEYVNECQDAAR